MDEILKTLALATIPVTIVTIIQWLLARRGANKKLEVEEGGLTVDIFNAQTATYQDLLNRANKATDAALTELEEYKKERGEMRARIEMLERADNEKTKELETTNIKLERLRDLLESYVKRAQVPMTQEELAVFEDTKPRKRFPRPRTS